MGIRILSIGVFGLLGVFCRYAAGVWVSELVRSPFPYGTFVINFVGSCLIGVAYVLGAERAILSDALLAGVMVGFLGGFTTFSSFSLEALRLFQEGRIPQFALYLFGSPIAGVLGAAAGMLATRRML